MPAACTSPRSGTEIRPSGRTGTVVVSSVFFHTEISRMSPGPMA
jgi:hypothetical protein